MLRRHAHCDLVTPQGLVLTVGPEGKVTGEAGLSGWIHNHLMLDRRPADFPAWFDEQFPEARLFVAAPDGVEEVGWGGLFDLSEEAWLNEFARNALQ
jgi:hypothetical protein